MVCNSLITFIYYNEFNKGGGDDVEKKDVCEMHEDRIALIENLQLRGSPTTEWYSLAFSGNVGMHISPILFTKKTSSSVIPSTMLNHHATEVKNSNTQFVGSAHGTPLMLKNSLFTTAK
jgi:hypothetical protein